MLFSTVKLYRFCSPGIKAGCLVEIPGGLTGRPCGVMSASSMPFLRVELFLSVLAGALSDVSEIFLFR